MSRCANTETLQPVLETSFGGVEDADTSFIAHLQFGRISTFGSSAVLDSGLAGQTGHDRTNARQKRHER